MNPATVISHSGHNTTIIHSDSVAARVLQKAMKSGDGKSVLGDTKAAAKDVPSQALAKTDQVSGSEPASRKTLSETAEKIMRVRACVDEARRALDDLTFAFQEIGDYRLMTVMSDDPTTLAFAANVLSLQSDQVLPENGTPLDEPLKFEFKVGLSTMIIEKLLPGDVFQVAEKAHVDFFVGAPDEMLADPINAYWEDGDLDVHFSSEDTLKLEGADKAGSIAMRYGDQVARLSMAKIPARFGLLDLAV